MGERSNEVLNNGSAFSELPLISDSLLFPRNQLTSRNFNQRLEPPTVSRVNDFATEVKFSHVTRRVL